MSFLPMYSSMALYSPLSGSANLARFAGSSMPVISLITRRVIRSITEVEREKFRYLQLNMMGGQAGRT